MRVLLILAAMMITASAQAKSISVQCATGEEVTYKKSIALSFEASESGNETLLQTLMINDQNRMEPARKQGEGFKASLVNGEWQLKVAVSLHPQYVPYDNSAAVMTVGGCGVDEAGKGKGTYFQHEYRTGASVYDMTCTCSAQ